jgi:hypothetical protein
METKLLYYCEPVSMNLILKIKKIKNGSKTEQPLSSKTACKNFCSKNKYAKYLLCLIINVLHLLCTGDLNALHMLFLLIITLIFYPSLILL